jgi:hypothetical protein
MRFNYGAADGQSHTDPMRLRGKEAAAEVLTLIGEQGGEPVKPATRKVRSERFGPDDLKELRKAIKAGDKKRISELTAKIGKPSFDN